MRRRTTDPTPQEAQGKPWRITTMRALYPDGSLLWNAPGRLQEYQDFYQTEGGAAYGAIFMQDPSALAGDVFSPEWFRYWVPIPVDPVEAERVAELQKLGYVDKILPSATAVTRGMGIDLAVSKKDSADYFARASGWVSVEGDLFIDSVRRARLPTLKILEEVMEHGGYSKRNPKAKVIGINEDLMEQVVLEVLPLVKGAGKMPWVPVPHESMDKVIRARPLAARYETGKVYHRYGAPWVQGFEAELASFPGGPFDDQVDAAVALWEVLSVYEPSDWKSLVELNKSMRVTPQLPTAPGWTERLT
jgi:predicted phage terminase large subunit-like protein